MLKEISIIHHNGRQYIPDLRKVNLRPPFRGRPVITDAEVEVEALLRTCPVGAIDKDPVRIDLGRCTFCNECAFRFPDKIRFTNDYRLGTNDPARLVVMEGQDAEIRLDPKQVRPEIREIFRRSFKLRQVSAGGDNSAELELNACSNANFDMNRYGLEFVASPRHADGILVTGPISANMAEALEIAYRAVPEPKVLILCGVDAISSGIFAGSPALDRSMLQQVSPDLLIPGNPPHPLTIINALLDLSGRG
jgi:Ni,Fe-hydrogenase III small subunit